MMHVGTIEEINSALELLQVMYLLGHTMLKLDFG
jgi:hypothetical protein